MGSTPTNRSSSQKTRINNLSYGIKIWAELSFVLSQSTRLTDRQTDGRTDGFLVGRRRCMQQFTVFTALHGMLTRSSDENSVCPSVRPSVCHTRELWQTVQRSVQICIPYERTFSLVFWAEEWLVGGDPFYLKFWVNQPPLQRNCRFSTSNRW